MQVVQRVLELSAIGAQMTVAQMANSWNPYLTIGEAVHLAAQSFTRDPAPLSCCA